MISPDSLRLDPGAACQASLSHSLSDCQCPASGPRQPPSLRLAGAGSARAAARYLRPGQTPPGPASARAATGAWALAPCRGSHRHRHRDGHCHCAGRQACLGMLPCQRRRAASRTRTPSQALGFKLSLSPAQAVSDSAQCDSNS